MIAPDTVTLIQAAQAGDKEACGRLVEENLGLIWSIAKRYTQRRWTTMTSTSWAAWAF